MNQLDSPFRWWVGRVEDRDDPLKIGRVRVRIFHLHGDTAALPTESLHWFQVQLPVTSASNQQVGRSPTGLQVDSVVWGFFLDGSEGQYGMVVGVIPAQGDVPELARGVNTIRKEPVGPEPESAYQAKYPYNHVQQSESGHVIEIDDTPNFERLHTFHRSGTYSEINAEGRRVNKIVGDDFTIVQKDQTVWIQGNLNVTVLGNVNIKALQATVEAPLTIVTGDLQVGGGISTGTKGGSGDVTIKGRVTATQDVVAGSISLQTHVHGGVQNGPSTTGLPQ